MEKSQKCSSCGKRLVGPGTTSFSCPTCGKTVFGRCEQCRDQSVSYQCQECGFQGP